MYNNHFISIIYSNKYLFFVFVSRRGQCWNNGQATGSGGARHYSAEPVHGRILQRFGPEVRAGHLRLIPLQRLTWRPSGPCREIRARLCCSAGERSEVNVPVGKRDANVSADQVADNRGDLGRRKDSDAKLKTNNRPTQTWHDQCILYNDNRQTKTKNIKHRKQIPDRV